MHDINFIFCRLFMKLKKYYMLRLLIFLSFLLFIDVYAFQAIRLLIQHKSLLVRGIIYGFYWLIPLAAITMLVFSDALGTANWPKGWLSVIRAFFFIAYLSKFMVAGILLIDDFRRLVLFLYDRWAPSPQVDTSRSRFLAQLALIIGGLPLVFLSYGMARNPYRYQVLRQRLQLRNLPPSLAGLRIVQLSDIHAGSFTRPDAVARAIDMVNALQPDLVFFTGDLVNNAAEEMLPYKEMFGRIQARYGVFSIFGNHDYGDYVMWPSEKAKRDNLELLKSIHREMGWQLLLNENRLLEIEGQQVAIIGVENYSALARFPKYGDLAKAYAGSEPAALKILLSHDPTHWEAGVVEKYADIQLTLSGHTHGMQFGVEIPGWIKWSPAQYVYKQWAGAYESGGQWLYVNRGFGFLGYPGRVGILPEISLLELA